MAAADQLTPGDSSGFTFGRFGAPTRALTSGINPPFTCEPFQRVRSLLGQPAVGINQIPKETCSTRRTVHRIKIDPASAEGSTGVWGL